MKQTNLNKSPDSSSGAPKMSFKNEVIWLIHLKRAVKHQYPDFPWHATLDVPRPWFVLTRRDIRVRNMTRYDTSRSLTRRVPIYDSPSVVEYHGPVNSTKLLISRSEQLRDFREFKQITTAGATTATVTEKVWGEYVSVVCQIFKFSE